MNIEWKRVITLFFIVTSYVTNGQIITTIAGTGTMGHTGDGGAATAAKVSSPFGLAIDAYGNCYFVEAVGNRIRKISLSGIITNIAGTGGGGYSGDGGPATAAQFNNLVGIAFDAIGNLYAADGWNNRVRKIDIATGIVTTIAGNGTAGYNGDGGPATAAMMSDPFDLCFDHLGNLYVADWGNNCIRKISTSGVITTVAGTGTPGFSGDGGPATAAEMQGIFGICLDTAGNLYLADRTNSRVRKVSTAGIITTIAGTGFGYSTGDGGPATAAQLNPERVKFDKQGNLYVSSRYKHCIRRIDANGIIHKVAGDTVGGYGGDGGPAIAAQFNSTVGIDFDVCGNLYVSDQNNHRVRKIALPLVLTIPAITLATEPTSALIGATVTVTATVTNAGSSYLLRWYNRGVQFAITTTPSVTYVKQPGTDTITARVVSTDAYGCYDSTMSATHTVSVTTVGVPFDRLTVTGVNVWPNPVGGELHFDDVAETSAFHIYSMVGTSMLNGVLKTGSNVVDVRELPAGIYVVEVSVRQAQDDRAVRRVLKRIIKQ